MAKWTVKDSNQLFNIENWGTGYFTINKYGNICVHDSPWSKNSIDMRQLIDDLIRRKIKTPILLRFMNILEDRIMTINKAFSDAIDEYSYPKKYQTFYPIKVNQQRQLVEAIAKYGKKFNIGLEVGSKPELVAALYVASNYNLPISEYIETILYATKIGYQITIVIEKLFELEEVINFYKKTGIKPTLGMRVKLSSKGIGKWASSGGENAKFGLKISEIISAIDVLKENHLLDRVKLLHFHIGSQITKIDRIKNALIEGARIYTGLRKLGLHIEYLDIGGGMGVDYDGSKSSFFSSVNYSIKEYASDVVYQIKNICDETNTECPNIISESGRSLVAHYSVLVTNVLNTDSDIAPNDLKEYEEYFGDKFSSTVKRLFEIYDSIDKHSLREDYHDTLQLIQEALSLFNLGYLNLHERAATELLYKKIIMKTGQILNKIQAIPEELQDLKTNLRETIFANFSLFQSLPDSWAIDQIFPIMPIQRLLEKPANICSIADITCDSDGEITQFVGEGGKTDFISLHDIGKNENYYIGFFLIGAYQEILGDLHNLFGDTNAVHITFQKKSDYKIETVIVGNTVSESLKYVQYNGPSILKNIRDYLEKSVSAKKISIEESIHFLELFEKGLNAYTYLSD